MKLLWVKTNLLHPLDTGGTIRSYQMLRHLRESHEVTFVALGSEDAEEPQRRAPEYCDRLIQVPWRGAPPRGHPRFYVQALANLRSDMPLALERYHVPALRERLAEIARREKFDIAISDFLFPAPHFDVLARMPTLLFQHNVESLIWRRMWERSQGPLRPYWRLQASRMRTWEEKLTRSFDHVVTVSREDAQLMREWFRAHKVSAIPTGVDTEYYRPDGSATPGPDLVFVGSLDWLPNIDAVRWLLSEIWPLIRHKRPGATLHVVGRRPGRRVKKILEAAPGAELHADVADIREHLHPAAVVVVPLRIGGGTRLKIFEALACEKAVVSTPVGAEGLPVRDGEHLLLAEEPKRFADSVLQLLEAPEERARLARSGRRLVVENFSWERVADAFTDICRRVTCRDMERVAP